MSHKLKSPGLRQLACLVIVVATGIGERGLADQGSPEPLTRALAEVRAAGGFLPPGRDEMTAATEAFGATFAGDTAAGARSDLMGLGFAVRPVALNDGTALAVSDPPDDVTGRGFYLIDRPADSTAAILLQAPHRFKDLDTGAIVAALAETGDFRAVAWNTVPRWSPDDRDDRRSDVAHIDVSYFNAFTRAFATHHPSGAVIQLHGFAKDNRRSAAGRKADVIVSNGTGTLTGPASVVRDCLSRALNVTVLGYGEDVFELGATTNRNAAMLRSIGFERFVHVEMARDLRRALLADGDLLGRVQSCFREGAG